MLGVRSGSVWSMYGGRIGTLGISGLGRSFGPPGAMWPHISRATSY